MANSNVGSPKMNSRSQGIVVCGTDTDVGKTIISTLLVQGLNAVYWKPIQSGLDSDRGEICKLLNLSSERHLPEAYAFENAVSPHWAAELEGDYIDPKQLSLPCIKSPLVIETAGGLLVPLNRSFLQIEQIKQWRLPVVLVVRSGLGTLNHTLLSLEALRKRNIPILGLFINGPKHRDNPKTLEQIGKVPVLAEIPQLAEVTEKTLKEQWLKHRLDITFKRLLNM